jgi:hypothetical protein
MTRNRSNILNTNIEDTMKISDDILNALQDDTYIPPPTHTNQTIIRYLKIADTVKISDDILNALQDDDMPNKSVFIEEPVNDEADTARVITISD